jgi:hypothetical protein
LVNERGADSRFDGALGGTAPNTTEPVPENVQLLFSWPHSLYCTPDTVIVACASAFCAPNDDSTVAAAAIPRSFN